MMQLALFAATRTRKERVLRLLSDGKWHSTLEITSPDIGGPEGARRLRELREAGYKIDMRKASGFAGIREYRLVA